MAVLLGFIDEPISEHYADKVDFTTNKLGGFPDFITPQNTYKKIICKLCGSVVPLLLQVYAPIKERLQHHRTLYVFACINPNCWGNSQSWICLKNQSIAEEKCSNVQYFSNEDWCSDANNWDSDEQRNSNQVSPLSDVAASLINSISVFEENANEVSHEAFTNGKSSVPTAEIEPDENEPITLDSPVFPSSNLVKLLKQKPSSSQIYKENIHFVPLFIYAMEEISEKDPLSDHVQNLLTDYSRLTGAKNEFKIMNNVNVSQQSDEKYEKSYPAHGDRLFHLFLSRIKKNPNQILRYYRSNNAPLFLYTESDIPIKCKYCHSDMIFEMQILPTVINYLQLSNDNRNHGDRLEFGSAFVYTCKESCDKSEEEYVVVQQEKI